MRYPTHKIDYSRGGERMHVVLSTVDGVPIACGTFMTRFPFATDPLAQASIMLGDPSTCECGGTYREPRPWGQSDYERGYGLPVVPEVE